jgi:hypothetical protein
MNDGIGIVLVPACGLMVTWFELLPLNDRCSDVAAYVWAKERLPLFVVDLT